MKVLRKEDRFSVKEAFLNTRVRRLKPGEKAEHSGTGNQFARLPIEIVQDEMSVEDDKKREVLFVYTEPPLNEKGIQRAARVQINCERRVDNGVPCEILDKKRLKNIVSSPEVFSPTFTMDQQEGSPCLLKFKSRQVEIHYGGRRYWAFNGSVYSTEEDLPAEVVKALILDQEEKHRAKVERAIAKANREEAEEWAGRQPISDDVKMFVWRRDEGKCVKCGSNYNLEFDHIIPVAMGGANTARNLQLLCEPCNRAKGASLV